MSQQDQNKKFKEQWVDYKLAVTEAYFSGAPPSTSDPLPNGIRAYEISPVLEALKTPTLPEDLAAYVNKDIEK